MGIALWQSSLFFITIALLSIMLFPSQRERGLLYSRTGIFDKARIFLSFQYHRDPGDMANAIRYLGSLSAAGEYDLWETTARKLTRTSPNHPGLHAHMAKFYEDNLKIVKAMPHWEEMIRWGHPKKKEAREKLISGYRLTGDHDGLLRFYGNEMARHSAGIEMYYETARMYARKKMATEARSVYLNLLKQFPGETKAKLRLVQIYEFQGKTQEALRLFSQVVQADPHNESLSQRWVEKLLQYKKERQAVSVLEKLLIRFPSNHLFIESLVDLYLRSGKNHEALILLEQSYERHPGNDKVLRYLGDVYFKMKEYLKAVETLRSYHEKTGGDYHSHHVLGDVLDAMGESVESRREYQKALELIRRDSL